MRKAIICALVSGLLFMLAHPPLHAMAKENYQQHEVVANELLVKMRPAVTESAGKAIHQKIGARLLHRFDQVGWQHIQLPAGMSVSEGIARYQQQANVLSVEPNYLYHTSALPNDPDFSQLWGLTKIQAPTAWSSTTGSNDVVVAVVDSGINYNHEDLHANMWQNSGAIADNSDDDADSYPDDIYGINAITHTGDPMDDYGHGTHVAGIIGAVGNNGLGVTGVNWTVKLMALKFLDSSGSGTTADAVKCFNYLIAMKKGGVNIRAVNASWSGDGYSQSLKDAIDSAGDLGIITVCAAGNDGVNIDASPEYPASYDSPSLITVTASDANDNMPSFANYGASHVAIAAPGVSILSTYYNSNTAYMTMTGTSMAVPYVTGAVALLSARNPGSSAAGIKSALLNSVDRLSQWSGKVASGGRLNLAKAIASIGSTPANQSSASSSATSAATKASIPAASSPPVRPSSTVRTKLN